MSDYSDLMKFAPSTDSAPVGTAPNGGTPEAPSAMSANTQAVQQPQGAPPTRAAPQPEQQAAPASPYGALAQFAPPAATTPAAQGDAHYNAIEESPLSLMERAMMGWVRTPQEQIKYLKTHFDDAALAPGPEGAAVVVKHDGKWFHANPSFEWKWDTADAAAGATVGAFGAGLPGAAAGALAGFAPSINTKNLMRGVGDFAQMTGEYGLRGAAAVEAGAATAGAVTAGTAPVLGPLAPVAGLVAGAGAAALGSAAADGADMASRQLMADGAPGKTPYKNADEINKELIASAMFGSESYVGGRLINYGAKAVAGRFAQTIKSFQDTPEGHESVRKLLGMLGAKPEEIEARLMNPQQNATFDAMRAADIARANPIGSGTLDMAQEGAAENLHTQVNELAKAQSNEFNAIANHPKVKTATHFDLSDGFAGAREELANGELITDKGAPNPLRVMGAADKEALNFIVDRKPMSSGLSYAEARATVGDVRALLDKDGLNNANVKRILVGLKDKAESSITQGLEKAEPGLGVRYGDVVNKYADVASLQRDLNSATSGNKRFTVGSKLLKDNPNETKGVMDSLVKAGVDPDTLVKFVQIEGSKNADSWFTNKRFTIGGVPIPKPGAKLGAMSITAVSNAKQAARQVATNVGNTEAAQSVLPYMNKIVQTMRNMPTGQVQQVLRNPQALDIISGTVAGAAANEKQHTEELLQQAGVK